MSILDKLREVRKEQERVTEQANPRTDPSLNPNDPKVSPVPTPQDNPNVKTEIEGQPTLLESLRVSAQHLSPSEVPAPNEIPAIVAAFVHYAENGELPKSQEDENDNGNVEE